MSISPSEKWAHGALDALDGAPNAREANVHLVIRRAGLAALIEPTAVGDASLLRHFVASVSRQNSVRFQRTGKKGDAATNARALAVYKADVQACPALLGHALLGPFERQFTTVHMPFTTRMHDILGSLVKNVHGPFTALLFTRVTADYVIDPATDASTAIYQPWDEAVCATFLQAQADGFFDGALDVGNRATRRVKNRPMEVRKGAVPVPPAPPAQAMPEEFEPEHVPTPPPSPGPRSDNSEQQEPPHVVSPPVRVRRMRQRYEPNKPAQPISDFASWAQGHIQ